MVSQTKVAFSLHIIFLNIYIHYSTVHIVHNLLCTLYNTYVQGTYLRPSERSGLPAPRWRRVRRGDELQRFCSRSNISRINRGDTQEPTITIHQIKISNICVPSKLTVARRIEGRLWSLKWFAAFIRKLRSKDFRGINYTYPPSLGIFPKTWNITGEMKKFGQISTIFGFI